MLIAGFPAGSFAANCYVVAPGPGEECVIIDPGQDAEAGIADILATHRLKPVAVMLTHGHIDHAAGAADAWCAPVLMRKGRPSGNVTSSRP